MSDTNSPIPRDNFSQQLRQANDNPGALRASSTIHASDFYGNTETWVCETFRLEADRDVVFIQRSAADGGMRLVIPAEVTRALARHRDQLSGAAKRRSGHRLIALRKERGDTLGNAAALERARANRKKGGRK